MSVLWGEMTRNIVDWRELLKPAFWEYRRAMRILRNAKSYLWATGGYQQGTLVVLAEATWRVQDHYYGEGYTRGFEDRYRHKYFWEAL